MPPMHIASSSPIIHLIVARLAEGTFTVHGPFADTSPVRNFELEGKCARILMDVPAAQSDFLVKTSHGLDIIDGYVGKTGSGEAFVKFSLRTERHDGLASSIAYNPKVSPLDIWSVREFIAPREDILLPEGEVKVEGVQALIRQAWGLSGIPVREMGRVETFRSKHVADERAKQILGEVANENCYFVDVDNVQVGLAAAEGKKVTKVVSVTRVDALGGVDMDRIKTVESAKMEIGTG